MIHYIAMSGTHGCLPDYCHTYDTIDEAVDALMDLHELDETLRTEFIEYQYIELTYGAEYAEVVECDCDDPDCHNDD